MKSRPLGATSPQGGCFIVRKILPAASVWRVAWRGLEWAPTGQAFGGRPGRTLIGSEKAPQAQEGTDRWEPQERRRRARSAAQSQSSFEMQKGKWGGMASGCWGAGRAQILSGLAAVIGAVQSRCFKAFGITPRRGPHRAHTQSGHALFRRHRAPLVRASETSVPPSPKAHC